MVKLTKAQERALDLLVCEGGEATAYEIQVSSNTLWALYWRDLVMQPNANDPGWLLTPRSMTWRITNEGRAALARARNEESPE